MPTSTPGIKIDAVRRLGGSVELVGETYSETQTYAQVPHLTPLTFPCPVQMMCRQLVLTQLQEVDERDCKASSLISCTSIRIPPLLKALPSCVSGLCGCAGKVC